MEAPLLILDICMPKLYKNIYFKAGETVAALGDAIVMSPILRRFARDCDKLYFPCRPTNYKTIACLLQDCNNIEVFSYSNKEEIEGFLRTKDCFVIEPPDVVISDIYLPGISGPVPIPVYWERQIYEYYDIPISARYHEFQLPNYVEGSDELYDQLTNGVADYCLLHQQTFFHTQGMINLNLQWWRFQHNLGPLKIIEIVPGITDNLLQYTKLIKNAKEIHCVNSSFFCLVDSITNKIDAHLFYHDIRATSMIHLNSKWNNYRWQYIPYSKKI